MVTIRIVSDKDTAVNNRFERMHYGPENNDCL